MEFCETLHSCSTLPADVHEGISLLSKIPKFEHHSIASGGYHSVRSLTVLVYYKLSYYKNLILNLLSGNLVIKLMKHKCGEIIYKDNRNWLVNILYNFQNACTKKYLKIKNTKILNVESNVYVCAM